MSQENYSLLYNKSLRLMSLYGGLTLGAQMRESYTGLEQAALQHSTRSTETLAQ